MKKVTYKQALRFFGNPNRMAKALGISRQAVADWKSIIPELRQYQIKVLMDESK
ncbi:MAG: Cro/Cl family transcriptional regulator [Blastopirellula sp.]|nr:MAG: Cro/Cl family transcriptional regulator [Blastopirellula sp.]